MRIDAGLLFWKAKILLADATARADPGAGGEHIMAIFNDAKVCIHSKSDMRSRSFRLAARRVKLARRVSKLGSDLPSFGIDSSTPDLDADPDRVSQPADDND